MVENVERLASLETTQNAMQGTLERISGHLERSAQERTAQYTETVLSLGVIKNELTNLKQDMQSYQDSCSRDRKDITDQVAAMKLDNATRTGKIIGASGAVSLIVSVAVGAGALAIQWFKKG